MAATDTLTHTQRRAIEALGDTLDVAESARRVGIEEEELLTWMGCDVAFIAAFGEAASSRRDEAFNDLMAELSWEWQE